METLRFLLVTTFYPPYHLGGDAVHVQYLAEALAERGHEVHVEYAPAAFTWKGGRTRGALEGDGVQLHPISGVLRGGHPVAAYLTGRSGTVTRFHGRLVSEIRPDVVHYHNISLLGLGVLDAPAERRLYTAHDYWLRCPRNDLFKYGRYPCDAPTCGRCALVSLRVPQPWRYGKRWQGARGLDWAIAPSDFMKGAIEGELECPVVTLPNFAPDANPRVRVYRPDDYYLYVGVYERHKGLLELASALKGQANGTRFVFVGRGSLGPRLRRLASRFDTVNVMPWLPSPRLAPFYRSARALVLPSLSPENCPLAAIEALSWGTPLLVAKRGGLEELIRRGAGMAFEPTPADIREAISQFEADGSPALRRQQARFTFEAQHHPVRYLERYMILIHEEGEEAVAKINEGAVAADHSGSPAHEGATS